MKNVIHIWPHPAEITDDQVTLSATIELPTADKQKLWYKIPLAWQESIADKADPFLIGSIFAAMTQRADIHVHGKVSASLLSNLERYQSVWKTWKPDLGDVANIKADLELESKTKISEKLAILPFSGGVDCSFTAYRHAHYLVGRNNVTIGAGLMVHGFDIPLANESAYNIAAKKAEELLKDINIPLIRVSTNWRTLAHNKSVNWEEAHATALIAVASLFQNSFSKCLIASGDLAYTKIQWGSNALTDPMLSSDDFQVVYDGASFSRVEKVDTIGDWHAARQNIRVCWQGKNLSENCCECEKCIQTILDFRVTGHGLPACFHKDVSNGQILAIPIHSKYVAENYKAILDHARKNSMGNESWVKVLEKRISWYHKPPLGHKLSIFVKQLRKKIRRIVPSRARK